ncbi:hypothetical protein EJ110_NYTH40903 [Nymphaea thermarum]|nr:hypothetical protein EJ110_NYTH40903 [Nymphaea thermarum]
MRHPDFHGLDGAAVYATSKLLSVEAWRRSEQHLLEDSPEMPATLQRPFRLLPCHHSRPHRKSISCVRSHHNASLRNCSSSSSSQCEQVQRYAVLGAGFAGLSVAWHLLKLSARDTGLHVDIYDEVGIGGGASGVAGGLVHPYSPKGMSSYIYHRDSRIKLKHCFVLYYFTNYTCFSFIWLYVTVKPLWRGAECWEEAMKLLRVAEIAAESRTSSWNNDISYETIDFNGPIFWRRGIIRPATKIKNLDIMTENARHHLQSCKLEIVTNDFVKKLMPDMIMPLNKAFYMPQAVNIHPMRYLQVMYVSQPFLLCKILICVTVLTFEFIPYPQALFFACQDLSGNSVVSGSPSKGMCFHKRQIKNLQELSEHFFQYIHRTDSCVASADAYTAVIICLGAKSGFLPELSGKLPLRMCRGIVMNMQLPHEFKEGYTENTPSILSDAWLAIQGTRDLIIGSTWDWSSPDYSSAVSGEEASSALQDLIPKASAVLPNISNWVFRNAKGGMRAMPPLTELGSVPLLGCLNDLVGGSPKCRYWFVGGLGARGLLYHAWLGKLMAKAVLSCDENQLPPELTAWKR